MALLGAIGRFCKMAEGSGVPECRGIDLEARRVIVHRPSPGDRDGRLATPSEAGSIATLPFSEAVIDIVELFA